MSEILTAWTGVISPDFIYLVYFGVIVHAVFSAIFDQFV